MKKSFFVVSDYHNVPNFSQKPVVTIGNFDGVHFGHQIVLQAALTAAMQRKCPALVLTFEPHPRSFFQSAHPLIRLTPAAQKRFLLMKMGFDGVIEQKFDAEFAACSAQDFMEKILFQTLQAQMVVVGHDFHFGQKRQGTPNLLQQVAAQKGIDVICVDGVTDSQNLLISSTRIRQALQAGQIAQANQNLHYHYFVEAEIVHGNALGRKLGFPTANMVFPEGLNLSYGVYAVKFRLPDGRIYDGVASFGQRPTITDNGQAVLETYLFDFDEDLYGKKCQLYFFDWLRAEEKFIGLEQLVAQIRQDILQAKSCLQKTKFLSSLDKNLLSLV